MGGWVKVTLGVLVAALVAVVIVSLTNSDDSTPSSTATVADGKPSSSADAKAGGEKSAGSESRKGAAEPDGGQAGKSAESAAPIDEELTESGGSEEQSAGDTESGGSDKGSKGGGNVGGLGEAASKGSKKKKKKSKAAQAPKVDPETAAASAVLEAYMAARAAQSWSAACAQMTPRAIASLERFAGAGRGCASTFAAFYPHLAPGTWDNTMTGPITSLRADGVAIYHGTTGRDYAMPMLKEGGAWKVAAVGPTAVS